MTMKRSSGETEFDSISSMASCLILLSRGHGYVTSSDNNAGYSNRVFECKTCNRQFPSFQALGGHRASHKRPKTDVMDGDNSNESSTGPSLPSKPKTHECSICGLAFSIGQALGGHMRRHSAAAAAAGIMSGLQNSSDSNTTTVKPTLLNAELRVAPVAKHVPVVRKSNSRKVLWLDLNLTPLENDLKLEMVKTTAPIFCYL